MNDWNDYRRQVVAGVGDLAKLNPNTVRGYTTLRALGPRPEHLDARTHELIALAVAVTLRRDGCITIHAEAARKLGVTREELAEALRLAVSINAGAAVVYSTRTLDAFQASKEG